MWNNHYITRVSLVIADAVIFCLRWQREQTNAVCTLLGFSPLLFQSNEDRGISAKKNKTRTPKCISIDLYIVTEYIL